MNKRDYKLGFTLVELLAVIVILAVILVIAVPQIMNVIDRAKTGSLESSVKLIAKRAEAYIEEQTILENEISNEFNCNEVAKISDTSYSNCTVYRVGRKALVSLDGIGNFSGKHVINGTKDLVTISDTKVTDLATDVIARSNNVNIDETADMNIRYSGENPNNYVYFNCGASDGSARAYGTTGYDYERSCEKWRIIGIFNVDNGNGVVEQRTKIIGDSLGLYSWDTTPAGVNNGFGYNIWETKTPAIPKSSKDSTTKADINRLLNEWYLDEEDSDNPVICYNAQNGDETANPQVGVKDCPSERLNATAKSMIDDAVWNLGAYTYTKISEYNHLPVLDAYNKERGTLTGSGFGEVAKAEWTGKVALPYVTDFAYASTNSECRSDARAGAQEGSYKCTKALGNWMHNSTYYWTLSPSSSYIDGVFSTVNDGFVYASNVCYSLGVKPVVYLKSSVRIVGDNDGSGSSPYILG